MPIFQPVNQVRLTNVAIVRLKRKGKRFEIACYKNKVVNYRNHVEFDLDEVLQTESVFSNVSKGQLAKAGDLQKAFGTTDPNEICKFILEKGELQISDKERQVELESTYRDIATIIADKCVNPDSNRPYPVSAIESIMKDVHFAPIPNRSAKQQALELIKVLKEHIPIERARMKVQLTIPAKDGKRVKAIIDNDPQVELVSQEWGQDTKMVCLIDPGAYRSLHELALRESRGSGSLDVIELSVQQEGEHSIDMAMKKKKNDTAATEATIIVDAPKVQEETPKKAAGLSCSTCGGNFGTDKQKHRQHFRSDWHRYNLKRKARKQPPMDEDTFLKIDEAALDDFFDQLE